MISIDNKIGVCDIIGNGETLLSEFAVIVNALRHKANIPEKILVLIMAKAIADKDLLKDSKTFSKDDMGALLNEVEKLKKENEKNEETEKESE